MPRGDETRPRRSWGQRLLIVANAVALVGAVVTAGSLAYSNSRLEGVGRVALGDVLVEEDVEPGDPMNVLIVGIDDASRLADDDSVKAFRDSPDVAGQHTDTIMVLRLDPRAGTAQIISLPRDLWVPIADTGTEQRINTALATGGPARLIKTIDENFGIPINHFVQVDFAGFRELVEIVDGVPIHFPRPARDRASGLAIEEPGCYTLGPVQALGFARARHYQVQDADGDWHEDPRSDLSRAARQQLFIELALSRAIAKGARNPNTLRRLVDLGASAVRFDDSFEVGQLVDIGIQYRSFQPTDLQTYDLVVTDDVLGGADILRFEEEASKPILAVFRGVDPAEGATDVEPEDVTVQVLNGTGTQDKGGAAAEGLAALGFATTGAGDAETVGGPTTVRFAPGAEAAAHLVARGIAGPVAYEPAEGPIDADVVVVTGTDWEGVASSVRSPEDVPAPPVAEGGATTSAPPTSGPDDSASSTTGPGTATTAPDAGTAPSDAAPDSDDPSDPGFYLAREADADEECPATD
ncbi:LCP family protein [Iamia sp. SCSIO 61187]|uniref:LCP family protein n=1 Tax=Iamia sp. SCSIO 61187 TaxID=2722752 RepID=UPI001C6329B5|nr:LCP family protein [Iamia sp. SCSIO 61187]QYG92446.1 LCP family protein [Iamia sp. SCSIO 61187]